MKKVVRVLSVLLLVLTLACLLFKLGLFLWVSCFNNSFVSVIVTHNASAGAGIIGGADGPTAILLTRSPASPAEILLPFLGIVLPVAGLILTKRK